MTSIKRGLFQLTVCIILGPGLPLNSVADMLKIIGSVTGVESQVSGNSVVILDFEIPEGRSGIGLEVVTADIEWPHSEISAGQTVRFQVLVPAEDLRSLAGRGSREAAIENALNEEPAIKSVHFPQDFRRGGSGSLSINVRPVIAAVLGSGGSRLQLIVTTQDMSPRDLAGASAAPLLTVRYGFLGQLKESLGHH